MPNPSNDKKYWAFVSYSSKDKRWGKWLHRRLENYPIPQEFQGTEIFDGAVLGKNLKKCFRDRDELPGAADLGPPILKALKNSRFLVVLCSKNSAQSQWVNKEITDFKALKLENGKRVLALILDGEPNATSNPDFTDIEECFPPALRAPHEPLAGDLRKEGDGKERGFLKVLSGISQIGFDTLYRRHERAQRKKRLLLSAAAILTITILSALTSYAFQQKSLANFERDKSVRSLAHNDYIQAQQYRTAGDYIMAFSHLARCLENNPENRNAAYLAWAMITNENLSFPHSKLALPNRVMDAVLTEDAQHVISIDGSHTVSTSSITKAGSLSPPRRLLTLESTHEPRAPESMKFLQRMPSGAISLNYTSDQYYALIIDPSTSAYKVSPEKAESQQINQDIISKIGRESSQKLLEIIEQHNNAINSDHILVEHPYREQLSELYSHAKDLDAIIVTRLGGTSREETISYIIPNGQVLISKTRPIHRAHFIKSLDRILIELSDYTSATYLANINLKQDVRYCYQDNFYSNIHLCRWIVDQTNHCLLAATQEGNYALVYDSPEAVEQTQEFLSTDYIGVKKLAQRKATCVLVCEFPILTASYHKESKTLLALSNRHFYHFSIVPPLSQAPPESIALLENTRSSDNVISTSVLNMNTMESFDILSENTHNNKLLTHLIDLNLIGKGSPITLPMPIKLKKKDSNLFFLGDNFWEYSHSTLLSLVDEDNSLVLNQGYFAPNHIINPHTPYIKSIPLGGENTFYWCPQPEDTPPDSLPKILNALVMARLDENNQLIAHPGIIKTGPETSKETYAHSTWHSLLKDIQSH